MNRFLIILLFVVLASCRPCKELSTTIVENDTLIVFRDSLIVIPADSALFNAWFECDSFNRVVMSKLETIEGRKLKPVIQFRDNWLSASVKIDSEQVYIKWKEVHTSSSIDQQEVKVQIQKVYPKWLIILALTGVISLTSLVVIVLYKVKKILPI
jgi:hypothetical protein